MPKRPFRTPPAGYTCPPELLETFTVMAIALESRVQIKSVRDYLLARRKTQAVRAQAISRAMAKLGLQDPRAGVAQ